MPGPLTVTVLFGFGQTLNTPERLLGMGNDTEVPPLLTVPPLLNVTGIHVPGGGTDCACAGALDIATSPRLASPHKAVNATAPTFRNITAPAVIQMALAALPPALLLLG
jgi:hypothetical protein